MAQDQQTFSRAANTALVGLGVQVALTIAVGILGLYAKSSALISETWHLLGGLPIWAVLWVLYNQHRLERVEALEADQLARTDAQAAALFEEAGEALALARKRLERLYKVGMKVVGLLVAVYLLGVGLWQSYATFTAFENNLLAARALDPDANLALIFMVVIIGGVVAFLTARYVSGMTDVEEWGSLRAGASYLMGNVLVLGLVVAAGVGAGFGETAGFSYVALAVPVIMAMLGAEILLSFVLSLYRPVRKGEFIRPVFDSRILGFLTRPESFGKIITDTINYQFGFEISRSWFYRLMSQATLPLTGLCILLVIAMTSVVIVEPQQQAIITTWGKQVGQPVGPGIHFKLPWPAGRVYKEDVTRVRQIIIGSRPGATTSITHTAVLWTNVHDENEKSNFLVTAPISSTADRDTALSIAGELIGGDVVVKYRIDDLDAYARAADDPDALIYASAEEQVSAYFATRSVDALLTSGPEEISATLRSQIKAALSRLNVGVEVIGVSVNSMHPPQDNEVAAAFHNQIAAEQRRQKLIANGQRDAVQTLAQVAGSPDTADQIEDAILELWRLRDATRDAAAAASGGAASGGGEATAAEKAELEQAARVEELINAAGGEAAQRILRARAERWRRAITEQGRSREYLAELLAYRQAPDYYRARLYLDILAQALKNRPKVVLDTQDNEHPLIRIEMQQSDTAIGSLLGESQ